MKRWIIFGYGVFCYVLFLLVFVYAILFIGNIWISRSMDSPQTSSTGYAIAINLSLLTFFAMTHSGMARFGFKRWITKYIPESAERSTYVLVSNFALILIFVFWQPIDGEIWAMESPSLRAAIMGLYFLGWGLVLYSTFVICHFDLFGLRHVWLQFKGKPYTQRNFKTPTAYRWVRHPLYVGWLTVFWAAPTMSVAHLIFAVATTAYILIAIQLEERDLVGVFGDRYEKYKEQVPMLIPFLGKKSKSR